MLNTTEFFPNAFYLCLWNSQVHRPTVCFSILELQRKTPARSLVGSVQAMRSPFRPSLSSEGHLTLAHSHA